MELADETDDEEQVLAMQGAVSSTSMASFALVVLVFAFLVAITLSGEEKLLAWKVSQVRTGAVGTYRYEASAMTCWVRMKVGRCLLSLKKKNKHFVLDLAITYSTDYG